MQCQNCNQCSATIHLTEITNGQRMETHLCEKCAQQQGLAIKTQVPLNELLSTLLAVQGQSQDQDDDWADDLDQTSCPRCGMTLKQFQKESLLGCPEDYEVFDKQLVPVIEKAQSGNTCHCGKIPTHSPQETKDHGKLLDLQKQLDIAVRQEDYELAAKLRDKIEKLK